MLCLVQKLKKSCWREAICFLIPFSEKFVHNLWKFVPPVGDSSTKMDSSRFDETWCVCSVDEEARVVSSSTSSWDEEGSSSLPFQQGWMSHGKGHDCLEREAVWEQDDLSLSADRRYLWTTLVRGPFNRSTSQLVTTNILGVPPFYRRHCLAGTTILFYFFHLSSGMWAGLQNPQRT